MAEITLGMGKDGRGRLGMGKDGRGILGIGIFYFSNQTHVDIYGNNIAIILFNRTVTVQY